MQPAQEHHMQVTPPRVLQLSSAVAASQCTAPDILALDALSPVTAALSESTWDDRAPPPQSLPPAVHEPPPLATSAASIAEQAFTAAFLAALSPPPPPSPPTSTGPCVGPCAGHLSQPHALPQPQDPSQPQLHASSPVARKAHPQLVPKMQPQLLAEEELLSESQRAYLPPQSQAPLQSQTHGGYYTQTHAHVLPPHAHSPYPVPSSQTGMPSASLGPLQTSQPSMLPSNSGQSQVPSQEQIVMPPHPPPMMQSETQAYSTMIPQSHGLSMVQSCAELLPFANASMPQHAQIPLASQSTPPFIATPQAPVIHQAPPTVGPASAPQIYVQSQPSLAAAPQPPVLASQMSPQASLFVQSQATLFGNSTQSFAPSSEPQSQAPNVISPPLVEGVPRPTKSRRDRKRGSPDIDTVPTGRPKIRRYSQATPSRFCHICARSVDIVELVPCKNVKYGVCRKAVCVKCFGEQGWDWETAINHPTTFSCCHCTKSCPGNAQCRTYQKTNERRRMTCMRKRLLIEDALANGGDVEAILKQSQF